MLKFLNVEAFEFFKQYFWDTDLIDGHYKFRVFKLPCLSIVGKL